MRILRRLFRQGKDPAPRRLLPRAEPTEAEQGAARKYWKAEVAADRKRRGATGKQA